MPGYNSLEKKLGFLKPLPVDENWSAAEDFLQLISDFCLQEKPRVIVECSSGVSSLVLARCCQLNRQGHVYSLENGSRFVKQSEQQLSAYSLNDYCDVIFSPLTGIVLNAENYQWYDINTFSEIETESRIDMLVIDGPPGFLQKNSRYPALPVLMTRLADSCSIFLDDAGRDDEKNIVEYWLRQFPEFQLTYIDNERGCSILKR